MSHLTRCKTPRPAQWLPHMRTRLTLLLTMLGTMLCTPLSTADEEPTAQPNFSRA